MWFNLNEANLRCDDGNLIALWYLCTFRYGLINEGELEELKTFFCTEFTLSVPCTLSGVMTVMPVPSVIISKLYLMEELPASHTM